MKCLFIVLLLEYIVACFCLFKLFPILYDNQPEIHCIQVWEGSVATGHPVQKPPNAKNI